jgi:hypothetical protein
MPRQQEFFTRMYMLSNRYLVAREYLDASVMRLKGGFTPFGEIASAQRHVCEIADIFDEMKKVIRDKDTDDASIKLHPERRDCCS